MFVLDLNLQDDVCGTNQNTSRGPKSGAELQNNSGGQEELIREDKSSPQQQNKQGNFGIFASFKLF